VVAQYDPALQVSQPLDPVEASNVPVAQLEHPTAPALEYAPAAHGPVTALSPSSLQNDPAVQASHSVDPDDTSNVPARQSEHAVSFSDAPNWPGEH
jgi:hypothetical protein